ncbi:MAG TPA: thiamine pyrophosphate-dependent dehydrogenase E1 component subunit alpha [Gammaproteobacteria bacterium]|nr:thiamine pyrophosphate-dependent dehydrogenase E1 component subunit alpha [Gammaproteobacteria bacterium]
MTTAPLSDERVALLRTMMLIRAVENAWAEAYFAEEITGIPPSLSTGQEAVAAGACAALADGDFVFTTHRGQAPQIARGLDPRRVLAELYCRRDGYNKGKSYHVTDVSRGVIGMGGVVPAQIPIAGGMALAQKLRGSDRVSLAFFGDGASNEGAFHETANLAAMWTLPLILLCENNGYCITQSVSEAIKAPSIASRAAAYGLPGLYVDGNDVLAVRDAVAEAVAHARAGKGATLIEARTERLAGHLCHDRQGYRPAGEVDAAWRGCPIERLRSALQEAGILDADAHARLQAGIAAQVADAVAFARASPFPASHEAFEDLWA